MPRKKAEKPDVAEKPKETELAEETEAMDLDGEKDEEDISNNLLLLDEDDRFELLVKKLNEVKIGQKLLAVRMDEMFRELYYVTLKLQKENKDLPDSRLLKRADGMIKSIRDDAISDMIDYTALGGDDPLGLEELQLD